jgi:hypothetical protein
MAKHPTRELGHALRNILAPAMMMAERLGEHPDPAVQRGGKIILQSLDRATAAIKEAVAKVPREEG